MFFRSQNELTVVTNMPRNEKPRPEFLEFEIWKIYQSSVRKKQCFRKPYCIYRRDFHWNFQNQMEQRYIRGLSTMITEENMLSSSWQWSHRVDLPRTWPVQWREEGITVRCTGPGLKKSLQNVLQCNRNAYYIYGDSGYSARTFFYVPFSWFNLNPAQSLFNMSI